MKESKSDHDILGAISSLQSGVDIIKSEWRINPEMVDKIIPLMIQKLEELKSDLSSVKEK